MKKLLLVFAAAAVGAVLALPGAAATPSGPAWSAGGSAPGTANVGIQATSIGTDVNPINGFWNQGWWSNNAFNFNWNTNYIAGHTSIPISINARNYFTFDITALNAHPCVTPLSATLSLERGEGAGPFFLNYRLYSVETDPFVLAEKDNNPDPFIFNDLGSGTIYGSYFLTPGAGTDIINLTLNQAGLNALIAAKQNGEQWFSIGGSLVPQPLAGEVYRFGFTGGVPARLTVNWPFICRIR
jgi:hypothetical protein